jgi:hypothetical protein
MKEEAVVEPQQSAQWRRSRRCESASCVEVTSHSGGIALRDSKHPDGAILLFSHAEWDAFVAGVRDGDFEF